MNEQDLPHPSFPQTDATVQMLTQALHKQGMQARISLKGDRLHVGLYLAHIKNRPSAVAHLYTLLETLLETESGLEPINTVYVYGLASTQKAKWKETFAMPHRGLTRDDVDLMSFNNRRGNAVVFPAITVLAFILNANPLTAVLLQGVHIWVHEFGHATVAWLSGYQAIPLPFGWTNTGLEQSLFVYFGVLVLLGLLGWSGYREHRLWPVVLAIALALLQFVMTWVLSDQTYRLLFFWGGIGGEFYLSTLLMVSFYFPLPDYWQWAFWRYPVAIAAAYTFWHIWLLWHQIDRGMAAIPWGTLWAGVGDANGDMNILSGEFGWSDQRIIGTYTALGDLCVFVLVGLYGYIVIRQNRSFLYGLWQRLIAQVM